MKKNLPLIILALALSFGLVACGQRMKPEAPEGKLIPSESY